jgi:hypothetical protein
VPIPLIELAAQVQDELDGLDLVGRHVDGAVRIINRRAPDMDIIVHRDGEILESRKFDADLTTLIIDADDHVVRVVHG